MASSTEVGPAFAFIMTTNHWTIRRISVSYVGCFNLSMFVSRG